MKCYRKNGSDEPRGVPPHAVPEPSMKCYRKNGSDVVRETPYPNRRTLNEVLPKER